MKKIFTHSELSINFKTKNQEKYTASKENKTKEQTQNIGLGLFCALKYFSIHLKRTRTEKKKQLSSQEENTCFLFYASALTSMFSPFHLDRELGCPSPGCNVPDLGPALLCKQKLLAVKGSHS